MKKGTLYIIPSAIAEGTSKEVINPQASEVIKSCHYFLVENIRTARRYISSLKLGLTIESLKFELLDKKTKNEQLKTLMAPLLAGKNAGVLSEAGCPGIADPGALAVEYAHKNKIKVVPLVGPSSILMALMASGFNGQSFAFHGYLPIDKQSRLSKIKKLEQDSMQLKQTQIFMDTPYRNEHLFRDILATCSKDTFLSIAADVTGSNEMIKTKTIGAWKSEQPKIHKIPVIFSLYVR